MAKTLKLSDSQAQRLLEHYIECKKVTRNKMLALDIELRDVENLIDQLKSSGAVAEISDDNRTVSSGLFNLSPGQYNPNWALNKKMMFALENAKRMLTAKEILEHIFKQEPNFKGGDGRKAFSQVSGTLSQKISDKKEFYREKKEGENEFRYGLLGWITEEDVLQKQRAETV